MNNYNKTQLNPEKTFEKHVFHRDQFAHYFRWCHVLKIAKTNMNILDLGCGNGNLWEVFYRNRFSPNLYRGIDIRKQTIKKLNEKWIDKDNCEFLQDDLVHMKTHNKDKNWDIICSFELVEHIGKNNVDKFLSNIYDLANKKTKILISTPNYDEKVGAAKNHIIDGEICEMTYHEFKYKLEIFFDIEKCYGTFASQKDYKLLLNEWQTKMFNELKNYYDVNLLSNIMACFFPKQSRNILWKVKK